MKVLSFMVGVNLCFQLCNVMLNTEHIILLMTDLCQNQFRLHIALLFQFVSFFQIFIKLLTLVLQNLRPKAKTSNRLCILLDQIKFVQRMICSDAR